VATLRFLLATALVVAVAAGCGGPRVDVTVEASANGKARTFTLTCDPDGGTAPEPGRLCREIAQHSEMLRPPPTTDTCIGPPELGQVIVAGTVNGDAAAFAARSCDSPKVRAEAVRRWLDGTLFSP
jgi:hypothetical protein